VRLFFCFSAARSCPLGGELGHFLVGNVQPSCSGVFFASLIAAMLVLVPRRMTYQHDNVTDMARVYRQLQGRKATLLRVAQITFLLGIGCVIAVILAILWQ